MRTPQPHDGSDAGAYAAQQRVCFLEQAKYFAERVASDAGGDAEARISRAYQIALSRGPDHDEFERNLGFLKKQTEYHRARGEDDPAGAALVDLCDVIFNLSEFVYVN